MSRGEKYCNDKGVGLIGDIPIFVAHDSCDVWAHPELFAQKPPACRRSSPVRHPMHSARPASSGSTRSTTGRKHKATGYDWWVRRFRHCLTQFDAARIDHFLGFCRYWEVPAGDRDARRGKWREPRRGCSPC
ncbi:MAG: 4-alpha-glucanotransferase [Phycisphaerales bacterium]